MGVVEDTDTRKPLSRAVFTMLELNFQYWLYSYLNLESTKTVFDGRINTTINQRHFHDPFYSIIIEQNIIFGQNLVMIWSKN